MSYLVNRMAGFKTFEELECWKKARALRNFVKNEIIPKIPNEERYGLISQIKRASRSVGNNIAEGFGRYHYQENIQFCRISRGSLNETLDHGIVAYDEGFISEKKLKELRDIHDNTLKILNGYIAYLRRSKFESK